MDDALAHGADCVVDAGSGDIVEAIKRETYGRGAEVGIDTTGIEKVINNMIDAMQIAGTCVILGTVEGALHIDNYMNRVVYRELVVRGIWGRLMYSTWELLKDIFQTGRMDPSHYVGAEYPLADYEQGMKNFSNVLGRIILYP